MFNITKLPRAEEDLIDIWVYGYENWGELQATNYSYQFDECFDLIAQNPQIGTSCDHLVQGCRKLVKNRHLIIYMIEKQTVVIVRVVGMAMDYENQL